MEEPSPRWPDWLERWYREALPRPATVAMFSDVLKTVWDSTPLHILLHNEFVISLKRGYKTPPEIDRRVRQRALDREARRD
jgi:hypothetical protein